MEDALLSPLGFSILSGAGLIEANSEDAHLHVHQTLQTYGTVVDHGEGSDHDYAIEVDATNALKTASGGYEIVCTGYDTAIYGMTLNTVGDPLKRLGTGIYTKTSSSGAVECVFTFKLTDIEDYEVGQQVLVLVDYYIIKTAGAYQIDIDPSQFGGNYYIEASTLFKRQADGADMPAEFVIPNAKVQSNFTFSLASTGDPSTFTFTLDAFPDYTKWNKSKKVLAAIQIIDDSLVVEEDAVEVHQNGGGLPTGATGDVSDIADV